MVKCICINDKNRPSRIPESKWIKEGQEYTIIFTMVVLPQKKLAVQLEEIDLDDSCKPFEFFLANRFAFTKEELEKLIVFIEECNHISMSIKDLMSQTTIDERATSTSQED